jgi:hypothetical protein
MAGLVVVTVDYADSRGAPIRAVGHQIVARLPSSTRARLRALGRRALVRRFHARRVRVRD